MAIFIAYILFIKLIAICMCLYFSNLVAILNGSMDLVIIFIYNKYSGSSTWLSGQNLVLCLPWPWVWPQRYAFRVDALSLTDWHWLNLNSYTTKLGKSRFIVSVELRRSNTLGILNQESLILTLKSGKWKPILKYLLY